MKLKYLMVAVACCVTVAACTKITVKQPVFDVATPKTTYKVNDTITFNFSGGADNIVFYSGMPGSNYSYINRTEAVGVPQVQFTTYLQNKGELNTLALMASTDFNGQYNAANIAAATWTDITNRATLSTGTDNTASGIVNLSDFLTVQNKPVYLAFKYLGYFSSTLKQPTWIIRTFNVNNVLPEGNASLISSIDIMLWQPVDVKNPTAVWVPATTGQATINGTIAGSTNVDNEDWLISRPLNLKSVAPDFGLSIQDIGSTKLTSYSYVPTTAGTYTVTFVAFNKSADDQSTIIKQLKITVTP